LKSKLEKKFEAQGFHLLGFSSMVRVS